MATPAAPDPPHRDRRAGASGVIALVVTLAAGLVCLVLLLAPGIGWSPWPAGARPSLWSIESRSTPASAGPAAGLAVAAIVERPDTFAGRRVTLSGEIGRLVGERGFTIGGDAFVEPDELLVLRRPETDDTVRGAAIHDLVQVTGTVMRLDPPAVVRALGTELNEALLRPWRGAPVLIADTVALAARVPGVLIERIARDPAQFEGRVVRIDGGLGALVGDYGFTLVPQGGPGIPAGGVLVVAAVPPWLLPGWPDWPASATDVSVTATGVVRRFDLQAAERELGVDLDDDAFAPYIGAPAVVARSATLPPGPPLRSRTPDG